MKIRKVQDFIDIDRLNSASSDISDFLFSLLYEVKNSIGIGEVSKKTGVGKESLYKSFSVDGNCSFRTIYKVLDVLDLEIKLVYKNKDYKGKKYIRFGSLAYTNSILAEQWHPTKNNLTPNDILPDSKKKFWWVCKKAGHVWLASPNFRNKQSNFYCRICYELKELK